MCHDLKPRQKTLVKNSFSFSTILCSNAVARREFTSILRENCRIIATIHTLSLSLSVSKYEVIYYYIFFQHLFVDIISLFVMVYCQWCVCVVFAQYVVKIIVSLNILIYKTFYNEWTAARMWWKGKNKISDRYSFARLCIWINDRKILILLLFLLLWHFFFLFSNMDCSYCELLEYFHLKWYEAAW